MGQWGGARVCVCVCVCVLKAICERWEGGVVEKRKEAEEQRQKKFYGKGIEQSRVIRCLEAVEEQREGMCFEVGWKRRDVVCN